MANKAAKGELKNNDDTQSNTQSAELRRLKKSIDDFSKMAVESFENLVSDLDRILEKSK